MRLVALLLHTHTRARHAGDFWFRGDGQAGHGDQSLRGTLLVVDRAVDVSAPLLHEFSFQAMLYDVLEVQGDNRVDYGEGEEKRQVRVRVSVRVSDYGEGEEKRQGRLLRTVSVALP